MLFIVINVINSIVVYPCVLRPSSFLAGRALLIADQPSLAVTPSQPALIRRFVMQDPSIDQDYLLIR